MNTFLRNNILFMKKNQENTANKQLRRILIYLKNEAIRPKVFIKKAKKYNFKKYI